jgi:hypothetical protein
MGAFTSSIANDQFEPSLIILSSPIVILITGGYWYALPLLWSMIAPIPPPKMMFPNMLAFVLETTLARASENPVFVHLTIKSLFER